MECITTEEEEEGESMKLGKDFFPSTLLLNLSHSRARPALVSISPLSLCIAFPFFCKLPALEKEERKCGESVIEKTGFLYMYMCVCVCPVTVFP